jgi:hypothetical protein
VAAEPIHGSVKTMQQMLPGYRYLAVRQTALLANGKWMKAFETGTDQRGLKFTPSNV